MTNDLPSLANLVRRWVLTSTTAAGSGHPTSCLSAVEALVGLFFGGALTAHLDDPHYPTNDRFILSKGHAAPLLYAVYAAAGALDSAELSTLRRAGSRLEGHPSIRWAGTSVATGSLGQGLAAGAGFALANRQRSLPGRVFVLLGDGEMMEGSNFEAMVLAAHEGLQNLIAAVDINGLGQRGPTIWGRRLAQWRAFGEAAGWRVLSARDGHDVHEVAALWSAAAEPDGRPTLLLLPTVKGQGISFLADASDRHGRALTDDELAAALDELPPVDETTQGVVAAPPDYQRGEGEAIAQSEPNWPRWGDDESVSTREAIGRSVAALAAADKTVTVLDAEVANSTFFAEAEAAAEDRFVECYIAEQTMVGLATGLARSGRHPWLATFAAFLTRAADQLRLAAYSAAELKVVGTHAGVSIGEDGPSQMGLEDLALFRSLSATVLYPADAVAATAAVRLAAATPGLCYLRATRGAEHPLYDESTEFAVGKGLVLRQSDKDVATVIAAGVTVGQALRAADIAAAAGLSIRVIDAFSIAPLDESLVRQAAHETGAVIVVEDHRPAGGLGEAVAGVLAGHWHGPFAHLAVRHQPGSATPAEQLHLARIDADAIINTITEILAVNKST